MFQLDWFSALGFCKVSLGLLDFGPQGNTHIPRLDFLPVETLIGLCIKVSMVESPIRLDFLLVEIPIGLSTGRI